MMTLTVWILGLVALASTIGWLSEAHKRVKIARRALATHEDAKRVYEEYENAKDQVAEFYNACRLIQIHRAGRLNVFTFMRKGDIFIIETMGMLSDVPDDWRKQAGLIPPTTGAK